MFIDSRGAPPSIRLVANIRWARRLALTIIVGLAATSITAGCGGEVAPINVLLISVDTLRADHLESYGYPLPTSPAIESLSRDAVTFDRAYTPIPKTTPAIASLMTGLYGQNHGVLELGIRLADRHTTLAELLRDAGYRTCGSVGQYNLTRRFGFDQGFETLGDYFPSGSDEIFGAFDPAVEKRGEQVAEEAIACLEAGDDRPFFVWAHFMDPHSAYDPPVDAPPGLERNLYPDDPLDRDRIRKKALVEGHLDLGFYLRNYDREIRYLDSQVEKLLDWLADAGLAESTVVVFTADHGEYIRERDLPPDFRAIFRNPSPEPILVPHFHHGATLSESEIRIPLIVKPAGTLAARTAGRRVSNVVELIDVVPTVLDLLDLEVTPQGSARLDGESLEAMMIDPDPGPPSGEALLYAHETNAIGLRTPEHKIYLHPFEKVEAVHRDRAPIESLHKGFLWLFEEAGMDTGTDVSFEERDRVTALRNRLFDKLEEVRRDGSAVRDAEIDRGEDLEDKLRALGYVE